MRDNIEKAKIFGEYTFEIHKPTGISYPRHIVEGLLTRGVKTLEEQIDGFVMCDFIDGELIPNEDNTTQTRQKILDTLPGLMMSNYNLYFLKKSDEKYVKIPTGERHLEGYEKSFSQVHTSSKPELLNQAISLFEQESNLGSNRYLLHGFNPGSRNKGLNLKITTF